jgi:HAMP domain-containing protein/HPt (histidine-containing phosphotransfer) domain-containing protein
VIKIKNTLLKKILVFAVIPFLISFILVSVVIIRAVYQDKLNQMDFSARILGRFNRKNLIGNVDMIRLAVTLTAAQLGNIDPGLQDARRRGEQAIRAAFVNDYVINSWLVFEPNAFDGRDHLHTDDYPGAPSGRYMRSYVMNEERLASAPDMDERYIDDFQKSPWYVIPRTTQRLFTDLCGSYGTAYDYGADRGPMVTATVAVPVIRDQVFIGCVGQDIFLEDLLKGEGAIPGASSVLFLPDGTVRYAANSEFLGKALRDLAFPQVSAIMEAFAAKQEISLPNVYSPFLGTRGFNYFTPVFFPGFNEYLYLYVAIPEERFLQNIYPLLKPISASLIVILFVFAAVLLYFARAISKPIHALTLASDAISRGNLDEEITVSRSTDEIGIMTRSLHRMMEQFRIYIIMQKRSAGLLDIYTKLHTAAYQNDNLKDVFDSMIAIICEQLCVRKASLVYVSGGNARLESLYTIEDGLDKGISRGSEPFFVQHDRVKSLLEGKKYLSLNAFLISQTKLEFVDRKTTSLCILPIMAGSSLCAYIILEGDEKTGAFIHEDTSLIFIADTLSYILTQKNALKDLARDALKTLAQDALKTLTRNSLRQSSAAFPAAVLPTGVEEKEGAEDSRERPAATGLEALRKARSIAVLDVDKGLSLAGGEEARFAGLLRLSARVFSNGVQSMKSLYANDMSAFAIEVHGMKGALYNIGADTLAEAAKKLELAAKAADSEYCAKEYPLFETRLLALVRELREVTRRDSGEGKEGCLREVRELLPKALAACERYEAMRAFKIISSLAGRSYAEDDSLGEALQEIAEELENIEYDEAQKLITQLMERLNGAEEP